MNRKARLYLMAVLVAVISWGMFVVFHADALAGAVTPLEGAKFETSQSLDDNLKLYTGKNIHVHLKSGKTIQGYVKSVGNHLLHIEKIEGRDFYDALVRIEEISAFEAKFRDMK
jgi:small nuclear ribonucleoprotein (snRNP)-like protein